MMDEVARAEARIVASQCQDEGFLLWALQDACADTHDNEGILKTGTLRAAGREYKVEMMGFSSGMPTRSGMFSTLLTSWRPTLSLPRLFPAYCAQYAAIYLQDSSRYHDIAGPQVVQGCSIQPDYQQVGHTCQAGIRHVKPDT